MLRLCFIWETPTERSWRSPFVMFVQSRAAPACSSDAPQGNANLPQTSMWFTSLRHAQIWDTLEIGQEIRIAWQKQDTCLSWTACDLCARPGHTKEPLRLLCRDRCWHCSYSRCSLLLPPWEQGKSRAYGHAKASLETPVPTSQGAVIFSLQELGSTQACVLMAELFIASRLSLGEPDFGCLENLCPQACTVAQYAFKIGVSGPHEEGDKEVWSSGIVLFGGFLIGLKNFVRGRVSTSAKSSLRFVFSIK